jgi:hypothetical protein
MPATGVTAVAEKSHLNVESTPVADSHSSLEDSMPRLADATGVFESARLARVDSTVGCNGVAAEPIAGGKSA